MARYKVNQTTGELTLLDEVGENAVCWDDVGAEAPSIQDPYLKQSDVDDSLSSLSENPVQNKVVKAALALNSIIPKNAGARNSIFRGENLGSEVTAEQYGAIGDGTFDGLFIGDYWTINNVIWRIAAFDYWLHSGDTECTTHHVVVVPDTRIVKSVKMNDSDITTGGYVGSDFYTGNNGNTGYESAKSIVNNAFGSTHILSHRQFFTNEVSEGKASGYAWYDSTVDLMNESMVYGHEVWASHHGYETGIDRGQLPLFALDPSRICNRQYWWLRDVNTAASFARVGRDGSALRGKASNTDDIRPVFGIKAAS